jgi:hypothetical protein
MNVRFCCLARSPAEVLPNVPTLLYYNPRLANLMQSIGRAQVVLSGEAESVANTLLDAGVTRVYVGEAALLDSGTVSRLLKRFGAGRIGLHVPVQRQAVSWSFETKSNADFRVLTPSLCEPAWEVLRADGDPSGVRALSWLEEMVHRGVQSVLVRADVCDDTDLNLCAGMVEAFGDKLWLAPLRGQTPAIADWISFGQATQLALPTPLYHLRKELMPQLADAGHAGPIS